MMWVNSLFEIQKKLLSEREKCYMENCEDMRQ